MISANNENQAIDDTTAARRSTTIQPAIWMRRVLIAAALYNLAWGAIAIITPLTVFDWFGFDPLPLYPEFFQCIGMIVGVYGVGYAIAARDPFRHWPIVLVGLLGKVFGPIGFLGSVLAGRLPASMGWTILTNDLIWWLPFTAILWRAAQAHQSSREQLTVPMLRTPVDPLGRMLSQFGSSLNEISRRQPVLVVLLRHSGCTFCREALSDIAGQRECIESLGTKIALVHMGKKEPEDLLDRHGLSDLHCFRDPMCHLYDLFGLRVGSFPQLFGVSVWFRGIKAGLAGHRLGALDGNAFRMPGAFLLYKGEPARAFRHKTAADRPDYVALATLPDPSAETTPVAATGARAAQQG